MLLSRLNILTQHKAISTLCVTLVLFLCLSGDQLLGRGEGARTLSIYNIHTKKTLTVVYKKDGKYIPSAMKRIDHIMGDWRRKESRVMNKGLIDLMWEMHNQLGSRKPIHLISGYRSQKTNNALRKRGGGQARKSRHILGMAADVHFPDVPVRELRDSALIRQRGGVGYYPTSGLPFVHLDVGRVRHWPRIARPQLAALFPSGRSKHIPRDGRPLTKADARKYGAAAKIAKMRRIQLARRQKRDGIAVAALTPPVQKTKPQTAPKVEPKLASLNRDALNEKIASLRPSTLEEPKRAKIRPTLAPKEKLDKKEQIASYKPSKKSITQQNEEKEKGVPDWWRNQTIASLSPLQTKLEEERQLVQLASVDADMPESWRSFAPRKKAQIIEQNNVAYSPEFDEEHPEELNYRPFSLSPLMINQPVAENEDLLKLSPPDYAQASVLLKDNQGIASSRFLPGLQIGSLGLANQFVGSAITDLTPPPTVKEERAKRKVKNRRVKYKKKRKKYRKKKPKKKEVKSNSFFGLF